MLPHGGCFLFGTPVNKSASSENQVHSRFDLAEQEAPQAGGHELRYDGNGPGNQAENAIFHGVFS